EVPAEADLGRAHDVAARLRVLVMAEVMAGHIGAHRVAVREREDHLESSVEPALVEDGAVDGVVRGDSAEEREPARDHEERDREAKVARGVDPLDRDESEVRRHEEEGLQIGSVAKHGKTVENLTATLSHETGSWKRPPRA